MVLARRCPACCTSGGRSLLLASLFASAGIVGAALMVASSGLTWWVTSAVTNRLDSLAADHGHPQQPAPTRRGLRGLLVVSGLAAVGVAAVAPLPEIATTATDARGRPRDRRLLRRSDTFATDARRRGERRWTSSPATSPHAYELIDVVAHDAPPGATYPGQERLFQFGAEQCVEHFEEIVGTPFMQSDLDVFMYVPTDGRLARRATATSSAWQLRVDGGPLEGTVVGSGQ